MPPTSFEFFKQTKIQPLRRVNGMAVVTQLTMAPQQERKGVTHSKSEAGPDTGDRKQKP